MFGTIERTLLLLQIPADQLSRIYRGAYKHTRIHLPTVCSSDALIS